jgi:hypothetical protein
MSLDTNGNTLAEFNIKSPEPNITNPESVLDLFMQAISKKLSQWQEIIQLKFIKQPLSNQQIWTRCVRAGKS